MEDGGRPICLDTNIITWGILEKCTEGQEALVAQARRFVESLDRAKTRAMIPSIVLAELLQGLPLERHEAFVRPISRRFFIAPFDAAAALAFGKLQKERESDGTIRSIREAGRSRDQVKADIMIVATAMSHGASAIYSHDDDVRRIAGRRIAVLRMPRLAGPQGELFPDPKSGK
ncbi:MAG: PIN domain-containing protein [Acidobacteria bacterium]|nr:PIN domain-containing protein [Acidobacteriota bacterium]